jgi:hypothetical protein
MPRRPLRLAVLGLAAALGSRAAPAATLAIGPSAYETERGADGGQPVAEMGVQDQSGADDDPTRYVRFDGTAAPYRGVHHFFVPAQAPLSRARSLTLQVSFRGPAGPWKWKVYDWKKRRFVKLGTSAGGAPDVWSLLEFPVKARKGSFARYADPATGEVRVRLQSRRRKGDALIDQEAIVLSAPDPPSLGSCPLLPADHWWNSRVDGLPVDPRSDDYVRALGAAASLHPDFGAGLWQGAPIGIPWASVSAGQPLVDVSFYYDDSDPGPYPVPPDVPIEGGPQSNGDRHVLVVDTDACLLYELFDAHPKADGSWRAGSGAVFDLTSDALRPDGWTSADAAGFAILPGLVRYEEVEAGEIAHALRFTAADIRAAHIWPARHHATCGGHGPGDLSVPPMGQRFRLKASFDASAYSPEVQVILTAMKRYGIVLADCGSSWFVSGAPDDRFDQDTLVSELHSVPGSAFEAVDTSSLQLDPDSAQAAPP